MRSANNLFTSSVLLASFLRALHNRTLEIVNHLVPPSLSLVKYPCICPFYSLVLYNRLFFHCLKCLSNTISSYPDFYREWTSSFHRGWLLRIGLLIKREAVTTNLGLLSVRKVINSLLKEKVWIFLEKWNCLRWHFIECFVPDPIDTILLEKHFHFWSRQSFERRTRKYVWTTYGLIWHLT